jgi:hypothetical protein
MRYEWNYVIGVLDGQFDTETTIERQIDTAPGQRPSGQVRYGTSVDHNIVIFKRPNVFNLTGHG